MSNSPTQDRRGSGFDLYNCQATLIWANEREVEAKYRDVRMAAEEHSVCWFLRRGSVEVEDDSGQVEAREGEWLFLRAAEGRQRFSEGSRLISIRFQFNRRGGSPVFARKQHRVLAGGSVPVLEEWAVRLVRQLKGWQKMGSLSVGRARIPMAENLRIESSFLGFLAEYAETMVGLGATVLEPPKRDERVERALAAIENHPADEKFSEPALARRTGLSINQLLRLFKRETGHSPFAYFDARRAETARHALAETDLPIKEIAFDLGFGTPSHFTNWFRKVHGQCPRDWRSASR